ARWAGSPVLCPRGPRRVLSGALGETLTGFLDRFGDDGLRLRSGCWVEGVGCGCDGALRSGNDLRGAELPVRRGGGARLDGVTSLSAPTAEVTIAARMSALSA